MRKSATRRSLIAGLGLIAGLTAAGPIARAADAPAKILLAAPPPIPGPKRTIAVGQFDVIGPIANSSVTSVGGPIAAMLTTALEESNAFIVVERPEPLRPSRLTTSFLPMSKLTPWRMWLLP